MMVLDARRSVSGIRGHHELSQCNVDGKSSLTPFLQGLNACNLTRSAVAEREPVLVFLCVCAQQCGFHHAFTVSHA